MKLTGEPQEILVLGLGNRLKEKAGGALNVNLNFAVISRSRLFCSNLAASIIDLDD